MRPSVCPAATRLPSLTFSASSVPLALARTTAVDGATSGPENSSRDVSRASCGWATSRAVNSRVTSFLPSGLALAIAPLIKSPTGNKPAT